MAAGCASRTVLVTLLVCDEDGVSSSCTRRPGHLRSPHGYPMGFEHVRPAKARTPPKVAMLPIASTKQAMPHRRTMGWASQGHPFVMALLAGTDIYAAAALGHVWVNDGWCNTRLACWNASSSTLAHVSMIQEFPDHRRLQRLPAWQRPGPHSPAGCKALSFSPDRSSLVWVEGEEYTIAYFGAPTGIDGADCGGNMPLWQPQTEHGLTRMRIGAARC